MKQLAGRVGDVITVEMKPVASIRGDFHRARVELEATKPLVRVVTLTSEGTESILIRIMYEKIARFCLHCGLMGHGHMESGSGEHADDDLQFGAWMIAGEESWRPGTPRFRNTPYTDCDGSRVSYANAEDRGGRTAG